MCGLCLLSRVCTVSKFPATPGRVQRCHGRSGGIFSGRREQNTEVESTVWPRPVDPSSEARASALLQGAVEATAAVHVLTVLANLLLVDSLDLCGKRGGSGFDPLAALCRLLSAPDRASGCPVQATASLGLPVSRVGRACRPHGPCSPPAPRPCSACRPPPPLQ